MIGIKHRCQPSDIEIRLELHTIVVICILDAFFLKLLKNVPFPAFTYSPNIPQRMVDEFKTWERSLRLRDYLRSSRVLFSNDKSSGNSNGFDRIALLLLLIPVNLILCQGKVVVKNCLHDFRLTICLATSTKIISVMCESKITITLDL